MQVQQWNSQRHVHASSGDYLSGFALPALVTTLREDRSAFSKRQTYITGQHIGSGDIERPEAPMQISSQPPLGWTLNP